MSQNALKLRDLQTLENYIAALMFRLYIHFVDSRENTVATNS